MVWSFHQAWHVQAIILSGSTACKVTRPTMDSGWLLLTISKVTYCRRCDATNSCVTSLPSCTGPAGSRLCKQKINARFYLKESRRSHYFSPMLCSTINIQHLRRICDNMNEWKRLLAEIKNIKLHTNKNTSNIKQYIYQRCYQVTKNMYGNPKSLNLSLINLAYRYKLIETTRLQQIFYTRNRYSIHNVNGYIVPCVNLSTSKRKLAGIVITYRFNKFVTVTPCTRIYS